MRIFLLTLSFSLCESLSFSLPVLLSYFFRIRLVRKRRPSPNWDRNYDNGTNDSFALGQHVQHTHTTFILLIMRKTREMFFLLKNLKWEKQIRQHTFFDLLKWVCARKVKERERDWLVGNPFLLLLLLLNHSNPFGMFTPWGTFKNTTQSGLGTKPMIIK